MVQSTTQNHMKYSYEQLMESLRDPKQYAADISPEKFFGFPLSPILRAEERLLSSDSPSTAYFSMEYGLAPSIYNSFTSSRPMTDANQFFTHEVFSNYWLCDYLFKIKIDKMLDIPIYSGGLGVLAGDTIKSIADLDIPVAALGILWNKGYFKQKFWYKHGQIPEQLKWDPDSYPGLIPLKNIIKIDTNEGLLHLRLWKYYVYSHDKKFVCPLILLDSNLDENPEHLKKLTDQLYRSDDVWWKIFQRSLLGIGGMKALKELGYSIDQYHLNEGHAAFAFLEKYITLDDKAKMDEAKKKFVFTCHTPVEAGHDRFQINDVKKILKDEYVEAAKKFGRVSKESTEINLTHMCLDNANRVNAVAKKHGEIMRLQFPNYKEKIQSVTNGIHMHTWLSESFANLFDQYQDTLGDWRHQPEGLLKVQDLKKDKAFRREIFEAHQENKRRLMDTLRNWRVRDDVFTLCWARRIAGYKRPSLIFHNVEEIIKIAHDVGPMQIILAGKAHPNDDIGSAHIDEILDHIDQLNSHREVVKVFILENYDTYFGKLLTNSVDVWLNNPLPPFEASGTSGMKAILNGVPQLTTLDGWIVEAEDDDIGWIFGYRHEGDDIGSEKNLRLDEDAQALCDTLREAVKLYYNTYKDGKINIKSAWIDKMINCVTASVFFGTQRMVNQYKQQMWSPSLKS